MTKNTDEEKGVIINVASVAAYEAAKGMIGYGASKGAVASITLPMARDLARYKIRVVCVAPSIIATPMTEPFMGDLKPILLKDYPLGKFGEPSDFAHFTIAVIENKFLNGTVHRLDGGNLNPYHP